jgi:hypothetical protein
VGVAGGLCTSDESAADVEPVALSFFCEDALRVWILAIVLTKADHIGVRRRSADCDTDRLWLVLAKPITQPTTFIEIEAAVPARSQSPDRQNSLVGKPASR